MPSHGAQGIEAVAVQAMDVIGGIGAAVGDHEQAGGQRQVLLQELELFEDGASAVAVSIQALTEDGQTALAIDHGGEADLNHEFLAGVIPALSLSVPTQKRGSPAKLVMRRTVVERSVIGRLPGFVLGGGPSRLG